MSHTPMKKSVFDRIERGGGNSSPSSGTTNTNHKSTHGFCNTYIKTGACPLGDACKFIHEQPNLDKQPGAKDEFRITKTITRVVDMSSPSIKSTVTVSHEQRSVSNSNSIPSSRTVVEGGTISNEQSDRRLSSSDRKQSQSRTSDSKRKSSSNSNESSKKKNRSSNKNKRSNESDSPFSSASDSDYNHSSYKRKKQSDIHSTSSKYKTHDSISPQHDEDVILSDQLIRQTQSNNKSPKRTIVITDRKKDENNKRTNKDNKTNPDIEFLGSKIINRDKKSIETIHQQAESNKKSLDIKRERKSPNKSSSDQQKRHSSSSTSNNEKNIQIKIDDTKHQSNKTQTLLFVILAYEYNIKFILKCVGIVTQTIVRRLLKLTDKNLSRHSINKRLAQEYKIIIESYPSRSYGKIEHIQNCINQIQQISSYSFDIQPYHVALFDDNLMNIKEAKKYFPAVLIPINEFNTRSKSIEPMISLIDQLTQQSWNEYEKTKTKRKYSRGDRLQGSEF
ncbi:unnamed protein product [Rotaria sp. Silwood1]|nr:unnamed protein product [Rotaria sp. Silwood1]